VIGIKPLNRPRRKLCMFPDWWVSNIRYQLHSEEILFPGNESRVRISSLMGEGGDTGERI
jgi:hypothetical protein